MKRIWIAALLLASCTNSSSHSDGAPPARAAESAPSLAGWQAFETNGQGTPAVWSARRGADGTAQIRVESANREQTFNLLLLEQARGPDVVLTTRLHADAGQLRSGGGLVWRAKDANNYYLARWSPLANDVGVYAIRDGIRRELASAAAQLDADAWHELQVRAHDAHVTVALDGRELLSLDDPTFADAGKIGLWTEADASTSFSVPTMETPAR